MVYDPNTGQIIAQQSPDLDNQFFARPPTTGDAAVARWELENDDIIEELRHSFRGEIYDYKKREYTLTPYSKPIMNDAGINSVLSVINNYLNKNTTLSYLEKQDIFNTMEALMWSLQKSLILNYEVYELNIMNDYELVLSLVEHGVYSSLMRAFEGKTMEYRRKVISAHENIIQREQTVDKTSRAKGLFSNLFGKKQASVPGMSPPGMNQ